MSFVPPPLTRDRLAIIIRALQRRGGEMKHRDLNRFNGIKWWEIEQAAEKGFIITEKRKPHTGRPSEWAILNGRPTATRPFWEPRKDSEGNPVSRNYPTKLPPAPNHSDRRINPREWKFAFWYVYGEFEPSAGPFGFRRRAGVAYMKSFPNCKSKKGARASASRLLKRQQARAAIAWEFAKLDRCPNLWRFFPERPSEIWNTLHRLGSDRAAWAPKSVRLQWAVVGQFVSAPPPIFRE